MYGSTRRVVPQAGPQDSASRGSARNRRKKPLDSPDATPEEIAASEAALRVWALGSLEKLLAKYERVAIARLREFGLPDDASLVQWDDLTPARRRDAQGCYALRYAARKTREAVATSPDAARAAGWMHSATSIAYALDLGDPLHLAKQRDLNRQRGERGREKRRESQATSKRRLVAEARAIRNKELRSGSKPSSRWRLAGLIHEQLERGEAAGAKVLSQKRIDAILAPAFPS